MFIKELQWFYDMFGTTLRHGNKLAHETLMALSVGHLFGICTAKEFADELGVPAQSFYKKQSEVSLYSARKLALQAMVKQAAERLRPILDKSPSTISRAGISISGDDTVIQRIGKTVRNTYRWYSGRAKGVVNGNDLLGLVLTVEGEILPLHLLFCSKQGRKNTSKPDLLLKMLTELKEAFKQEGIDITKFPLTLDSWFASEPLRKALYVLGFKNITIAGKSNYVFTVGKEKKKAIEWKKQLELSDSQWAVDVPSCRVRAESPTFGVVALLFFRKKSTRVYYLIDFSEKLRREAEIWRAWKLHYTVERFWKTLKSVFDLKSIQLRGDGLYTGLLIKILAYLLVIRLKSQKDHAKLSVLQILRKIRRESRLENVINEHFHGILPRESLCLR